jgi:hypothetical protein
MNIGLSDTICHRLRGQVCGYRSVYYLGWRGIALSRALADGYRKKFG